MLILTTVVRGAELPSENTSSDVFWLWAFLGRLHPMVVHFPISLIVVAGFMEVIAWMRPKVDLRFAIHVLITIGAISSIVAVAFGLMLAEHETYGSDVLPIHQWTGIATMVLSLMTFYTSSRNAVKPTRFLLATTIISVCAAGHYGASITHGDDYLSSVLPFNGSTPIHAISDSMRNVRNGKLTSHQVQELSLQVRTIFAHHCYKCHGQTKVKGKLRLDSKAHIMSGGEDGVIVVPGKPGDSELIRRVTLPRNHKEAMPEKGERLTKDEIAWLEFWIAQGAPWPEGPEKSLYRVAALAPRLPAVPVDGEQQSPIDKFVDSYFKKNNVEWREPVDDHLYIRRAYLDVLGLLPSPDSVEAFVNDTGADKRNLLVSRLLQRNDDYAQHWITFWNDALRNDYSGTGYITGGRSDITAWLYTSLRENKPYDRFVRELISPAKESKGFIEGIKWRGTINASQRTEMQAAQNVSQVFLGLNLKCASCHDSFVSDWKLDEAYAFANIFADTTLEINRCDKPTGRFAERRMIFKELGTINPEAVTSERLKQLADFLVQPKDGRLYRTLVNRIWAQLMGRGIVEPVDVMDNEPWSQDLLDWLASDFVASGYDIKKLIFNILTSNTYQLPSVALKEPALITTPDYVFKGMLRRRMTAEQFADAVSLSIEPIYADTLVVSKLLPSSMGSIPFARASLVRNDPFLTALGRPNRETVSTSRTSQANLLQALELTNGTHFNEAIKRGATEWRKKYADPTIMIEQLYRCSLGRLPVPGEMEIAKRTLGNKPSQDAVEDFIWAMTLHPEFQLIY